MDIRIETGGNSYTIDHITTNLMTGRKDDKSSLHAHPVFHIMYVLEGNATFTVGSNLSDVSSGMLYIINPNEPHQFHFGMDGQPMTNLESTFLLRNRHGEPAEVDYFEMIEEKSNIRLPETIKSGPLVVPTRFRPMLTEGYRRILDLYDSPLLKRHYGLMVADLLTRVETIVLNANRAEEIRDPAEDAVDRIKQYLHANLHRTVTLRELSDSIHITPNYLCRLFKEHTGETPMGFLQSIRMREAENLLALTDLPVYMIAEKLGYEEPSYFARVFRQAFGLSPQAYRGRLILQNRIK